jgi:hypothetical protein
METQDRPAPDVSIGMMDRMCYTKIRKMRRRPLLSPA